MEGAERKNYQPKILYLVKLSLEMKKKECSKINNAEEVHITKPALPKKKTKTKTP